MSVCGSPRVFACMIMFSCHFWHLDLDGVSAEKLQGGHGVEMERDNLSRIHGKKKYPVVSVRWFPPCQCTKAMSRLNGLDCSTLFLSAASKSLKSTHRVVVVHGIVHDETVGVLFLQRLCLAAIAVKRRQKESETNGMHSEK